MTAVVTFSAIPSPGSNELVLGPLHLRMYGVMIALGVIAGVWLARRRWAARGGDPEDFTSIAIWGVLAGLVGARLYHVITDNQLYRENWGAALRIWDGGLGIPGGIVAGVAAGVYVGWRRGMRISVGLDTVAPCLPLAQAIGRWGNWWNQELFGGPTDLPWGLSIDPRHRPAAFRDVATFHPTFLYESLWNLGLCGLLILVDRRKVLRPGRVFALYVGGYFLGRLWVEALRSDRANLIFGLRVNTWISLLAVAGAVAFLAIGGFRRRPDDRDDPYTDGHVFDPATATHQPPPVPAAGPSEGGVEEAGRDEPPATDGGRGPATGGGAEATATPDDGGG